MKMTKILAGLLAASAIVTAGQASAATETATMNVTATINNTCSFNTINDLAFGTTSATNFAQKATGSFVIHCASEPSAAPSVIVDDGLNAGGTSSVRRMSTGGGSPSLMPYYLFDGTTSTTDLAKGASVTLSNTSNDYTGTFTAQILSGIATPYTAGTYSDTLTLTMTYTP